MIVVSDFKLPEGIAAHGIVIGVFLTDDEEVLFPTSDPLMLFLEDANLEHNFWRGGTLSEVSAWKRFRHLVEVDAD